MIKFTFFLLFIFVILLGCKSTDKYPDKIGSLIINTSVENGLTTPTGWWRKDNPNLYFWTKGIAHTFERSLKIYSKTDINDFSFWTQTISRNIPVGKILTLKVFIKTENMEGDGAAIAIRGDDFTSPSGNAEIFKTTQGIQKITGTNDWKEYSVKMDKPISETIKSITIYLIRLNNTKGDVYFDDISLEAE
jgi:hypothetical protein